MDDLKWIKEVSSDKVTVLTFLLELRFPANFKNAYHKRKDLLQDYLVKVEKLHISTKNGTVEYTVTETLIKKLKYTLDLVEQYGPSGCKDTRRYGQGKYVNNALKGMKRTVKESIDFIGNEEDSLWWLDCGSDDGRFYGRTTYTNYYIREEKEDKWWKRYTGENRNKTF
jgi:hypothetical protein